MKSIVIAICPDVKFKGEMRGEWPSMNACAKDLGLQASHISEVCAGKRKQHKGYIFTKIEEEL